MSRSEVRFLRAYEADVGQHDATEADFSGHWLLTQCLLAMHIRQAVDVAKTRVQPLAN